METQIIKQSDFTPELYTQEQLDCVENHIKKHFGKIGHIFHENVSPDIHVDVYVVEPTEEKNYYTLLTVGMGAHKMNVPENIGDETLARAELLIKLPPTWDIKAYEEEYYWPLRWIRQMTRYPIKYDTWLGYGYIYTAKETFAENTDFSSLLFDIPITSGKEACICTLPDGKPLRFFQMIPLYKEEVAYRSEKGISALFRLLGNEYPDILDISRQNFVEKFGAVEK
ncbi:suppressor of fused domain protein [Dysgonomonas sp. 511]|uniref:suppressor of fused domain protein n=1 Tax=Dysgonomonas sp. 511 TaxID=2302930 RepID=UPI0013D0305B|nr:suppressor of fused domain protein [Dysgonomonas sp. 511]NDV78325.1 suppressor of fused domain protein [Dysgonomonas sp. 511]